MMVENMKTMIKRGWIEWGKRQKKAELKKKNGIWIDPYTKKPKVVP